MEKSLRPYQQAIVDQVVDIPRDYVICLPTGAGKTVIANALMEALDTWREEIIRKMFAAAGNIQH